MIRTILASSSVCVGGRWTSLGRFGSLGSAVRPVSRSRPLPSVAFAAGLALMGAVMCATGCGKADGKNGEGLPATTIVTSPLVPLTPPQVDLGARECSPGDEIVVEWIFECLAAELNNLTATSSCSCTNSKLSAAEARAGERITMTAAFRFAKEGQQFASIRIHDGGRVLAETSVSAQIVFAESLAVVGCHVAADGSRSTLSLVYIGRSPPATLDLALDGTDVALSGPELVWQAVSKPSAAGRGLWIADIEVRLPSPSDADLRCVIRAGAASVSVYPHSLAQLDRILEASHGNS